MLIVEVALLRFRVLRLHVQNDSILWREDEKDILRRVGDEVGGLTFELLLESVNILYLFVEHIQFEYLAACAEHDPTYFFFEEVEAHADLALELRDLIKFDLRFKVEAIARLVLQTGLTLKNLHSLGIELVHHQLLSGDHCEHHLGGAFLCCENLDGLPCSRGHVFDGQLDVLEPIE